jgi:hypothetical protein
MMSARVPEQRCWAKEAAVRHARLLTECEAAMIRQYRKMDVVTRQAVRTPRIQVETIGRNVRRLNTNSWSPLMSDQLKSEPFSPVV